jgi:hypothetical protein
MVSYDFSTFAKHPATWSKDKTQFAKSQLLRHPDLREALRHLATEIAAGEKLFGKVYCLA